MEPSIDRPIDRDDLFPRQTAASGALDRSASSVKIAHLTTVHQPLDVRIFKKQCCSLARSGRHVTLICSGAESGLVDGVHVVSIGPRPTNRVSRMVFHSWRAFQAARRSGASIIHFHDPELIPVGLALKALGRRVIYDVHEDVPKAILSKPYLWQPARRVIAIAIRVVETTAAARFDGIFAATLAITRSFPPPKTQAIQNFPIIGELAVAQSADYRSRPKSVIYAGGISSIRAAVEMVDAIAMVQSANSSLLMAGPMQTSDILERLHRSAGWPKTEYFGTLNRQDLGTKLSLARAGLVLFHPEPNHVEAQPNKLFEYWSAGLPIIASDFPLWRQIVSDVGGGLLVDPTDAKAIARAIEWIMENEDEAAAMGERGRQAVAERYNWAAEEKKLLRFYGKMED